MCGFSAHLLLTILVKEIINMEEIHGAVNIKAPVEVVQVALKGLLGYKGIETPESYSFDRYRIKHCLGNIRPVREKSSLRK